MVGRATRSIVTVAAAFACLALPASAGATTYCVVQVGSCPDSETTQGSVQAALTVAGADFPGPNTIHIGPGTYEAAGPGFDYATPGAPVVNIQGAGQGLTTLQASSGAPFVLRVGIAGSSVSRLSINLSAPTTAGLILAGAATLAQHVAVTGTDTPAGADGVQLNGAATFADGSVAMPHSSNAAIMQASGATGFVTRTTLSGAVGLATASSGYPGLSATNVEISASQHGASAADTATLAIGSSLIVMHGASPAALASDNADLSVDSSTIIGPGSSGSGNGGIGGTIAASNASSASLTLENSILRGFNSSFTRAASGPGTAANLTARYDDLHVSNSGSGSVPGTVTFHHNIDTDPRFVDASAGDYRLRARSDAIDAGGPCDSACQHGSDLDGLVPPIDGDGDGTATRDLGAYEYGHRTPDAVAVTVVSTAVGAATSFDASGSTDPDDGDQLSYAWAFDDGGTGAGVVASHTFTTAGVHQATLTVTDPTGLSSQSTVGLRVVAAASVPSPGHHHRPTIKGLTLTPSTFAVSPKATVVSARVAATRSRRHSKPRRRSKMKGQSSAPVGSSIRFTLSETSTITIAVERLLTGHRSHGHCLSSARRGPACTVFESAGTLRRTAVRGGSVTIAFSGRVGQRALPAGRYQLHVIATNTVREVSAAVRAPFTIVAR